MKKRCILVLVFFAFIASAQQRYVPGKLVPAIGVRQKDLSNADLKVRERGIVDSLKFRVATNPAVLEGAERMLSPKIQDAITQAAKEYKLPKQWLEAIAFLESNGDLNAASGTGPVGLFQISRAVAKDEHLEIRYEKVQKTKVVGKGKKKRAVKYWDKEIVYDERKDPYASARAAARLLVKRQAVYGGRLDWAVASYHSGGRPIRDWIRSYSGKSDMTETEAGRWVLNQNLSVAGMFFCCSPVYRVDTYDEIQAYMSPEEDYSPTYLFRVMAAMELLEWYRLDKSGCEKYIRGNWNKYKPGAPARSRMYAWFTREDFFLKTLGDLQEAASNRKGTQLLYRVPNRPQQLGFYPRLTGLHPIGEADMEHQDAYRYLRPSGIGLLAYVAYEYKQLCEAGSPKARNNRHCSDLDVTGLSRTLAYQGDLKKAVAAARTGWPTHTTGWVFDLSLKNMSDFESECLLFVLQSLEYMDRISFVDESNISPTYHTLSSPQARQFFADRFEEVKKLVGKENVPSKPIVVTPPQTTKPSELPQVVASAKKKAEKKLGKKKTSPVETAAIPKPPVEEPTVEDKPAVEEPARADAPARRVWRVPAPAPKQEGPTLWRVPAPKQ